MRASLAAPGAPGFNHADKADVFTADHAIGDADPDRYSALVLPGGVVNSDDPRIAGATTFVRRFFEAGKPVAVICHGPWALVKADLIQGRTILGENLFLARPLCQDDRVCAYMRT